MPHNKNHIDPAKKYNPMRTAMYDELLSRGADTTSVNIISEAIRNMESGGNYAASQKDGGPARGAYQMEMGASNHAKTATNRLTNFINANFDTKPKDKTFYQVSKQAQPNVSYLQPGTQDAVFIADMMYGDSAKDYQNLIYGDDKPTSEQVFEVWGKHHKKKFKVPGTKNTMVSFDNMTKEHKDMEFKKWQDRSGMKKYQSGGNVITPDDLYQIDANQINSNVLTTTGNYYGPFSDSAAQMGTQINLDAVGTSAQEQVGEQAGGSALGKVADVAAVAMTGMEMVSDYSSGVRGYKDFYKDSPDDIAYDKKSQTTMLKEARAQKYGAAAEGVGFALGTILTGGNVAAGRLIGNIAEFGAEAFSKLFGVGRKAKRHMRKQQFEHMTYLQGEESKASYEAYKEKQAKQISEYISGLTDTGKIAYAELGGMLYGPSHAEGGIPIEVEGGEFIVKKSAIDDNKVKTITGTNRQIASKINADAGGKNPFPGAKINIYG